MLFADAWCRICACRYDLFSAISAISFILFVQPDNPCYLMIHVTKVVGNKNIQLVKSWIKLLVCILIRSCNCTCFAALAAGDPHLATLDGKEYSFNGVGDFILVQDVNSSVVIQVRAEQATDKDGMYLMPISTLVRWQSKTFLTIDKRGTKIVRNRVFDCHVSPIGWQMAIKNSVSNDFWSTFVDSIDFFACHLPSVISIHWIYGVKLSGLFLNEQVWDWLS